MGPKEGGKNSISNWDNFHIIRKSTKTRYSLELVEASLKEKYEQGFNLWIIYLAPNILHVFVCFKSGIQMNIGFNTTKQGDIMTLH